MTIKVKGYDITGTPEEITHLIDLLADEPIVKAMDALTNNVKPERKPRKAIDWGKAKALRDAGWTYKAIADELGVSLITVSKHLEEAVK